MPNENLCSEVLSCLQELNIEIGGEQMQTFVPPMSLPTWDGGRVHFDEAINWALNGFTANISRDKFDPVEAVFTTIAGFGSGFWGQNKERIVGAWETRVAPAPENFFLAFRDWLHNDLGVGYLGPTINIGPQDENLQGFNQQDIFSDEFLALLASGDSSGAFMSLFMSNAYEQRLLGGESPVYPPGVYPSMDMETWLAQQGNIMPGIPYDPSYLHNPPIDDFGPINLDGFASLRGSGVNDQSINTEGLFNQAVTNGQDELEATTEESIGIIQTEGDTALGNIRDEQQSAVGAIESARRNALQAIRSAAGSIGGGGPDPIEFQTEAHLAEIP